MEEKKKMTTKKKKTKREKRRFHISGGLSFFLFFFFPPTYLVLQLATFFKSVTNLQVFRDPQQQTFTFICCFYSALLLFF